MVEFKTVIVLVLLGVCLVGFAVAVPVFPYTFEETYEVDVYYEEQEAYVVSIPVYTSNDIVTSLLSESPSPLLGGYYYRWGFDISIWREVEFKVSASDTVKLFIFTDSQMDNYEDTGIADPNEVESIYMSSGSIFYWTDKLIANTYWFVIENGYDESVDIYDISITTTYRDQEETYKTEIRYRTVPTFRRETHTRTVTEKVTLFDLLLNTLSGTPE